jgi:hypothetical protein
LASLLCDLFTYGFYKIFLRIEPLPGSDLSFINFERFGNSMNLVGFNILDGKADFEKIKE